VGEETDRGGRSNGGGDRLVIACQSKGGGGVTWLGGLWGRLWRAAPASLPARRRQRIGKGAPVLEGAREGGRAGGRGRDATEGRRKGEEKKGKRKTEKREKKTKKRKRKIREEI
jgi:hypothetical protein